MNLTFAPLPRRQTLAGLLIAGLAALPAAVLAADGHAPHWEYSGKAGPAQWGKIAPEFGTCATGHAQTPIDVKGATPADLPALQFSYGSMPLNLVNNGHTVQVNASGENKLNVGGREFKLLQFHFHTPSEEAINGKRFAMVAHFVHKDADGKLGVVGLLLKPGKPNAAFKAVFDNLPTQPNADAPATPAGLSLDLAALLPAKLSYYSFDGSLTTPPCSEGVSWMVLREPVELSPAQIKQFRRIFAHNARPLQPLGDRKVLASP
ncbi:carbonic anhydrase [Pelomonas saccharophila]|uniref:carbonic anhydrase n=1 Tax=Roseateles saccharophilus TaxID=304 RepID=A0ABU1YRC1_ROSSA|nr:carbonic anhydrase family protein [Roseateles saccharophilus]MDR7271411.1 carbonic anhydrase [Roseateles saccharophilus]